MHEHVNIEAVSGSCLENLEGKRLARAALDYRVRRGGTRKAASTASVWCCKDVHVQYPCGY